MKVLSLALKVEISFNKTEGFTKTTAPIARLVVMLMEHLVTFVL
jgi:hypothetical protein